MWIVLALAGCRAPTAPIGPTPFAAPEPRLELTPQVPPEAHGALADRGVPVPAAHLAELGASSRRAADDSILLSLASPLTDAAIARDGGEAIDEAFEVFDASEIAFYGAGLLTQIQLFGDVFHEPICESPELDVTLYDADGTAWDAELQVPQFVPFVGDLEPQMVEISSACRSGLAAAAGDTAAAIASGDCSDQEEHEFLGAACAACVQGNAGDFDACVTAEACAEVAPEMTWVLEHGEKAWYPIVQGVALACRPDWLALVYVLAQVGPNGELPQSYDHASWNYYCFPIFTPETGTVEYYCDAGDSPTRGHTLGEGVVGRTIGMTDPDGRVAFGQRQYFTPRVDLDTGAELRWSWMNSTNLGRLSKPITVDDTNGDGASGPGDEGWGYADDGWGIDPHALRPGGVDPTSLDDTFARDWFALLALKTATTMDGVSINPFNHSRCVQWEGADASGRDRCLQTAPPDGAWLEDALNYGTTLADGQRYDYPVPITTIGSTGLPDPDVPGGIVPLIAGSERLAEAEWDNCVWPHSFVTDLIPYPDTPWDYEGPHSLIGDTYHFGKDADLDLRMVLNTNIARHYCPADPVLR